ncbi:long chain acyl-CoA synthetase 4 [Striga asiatica]|uniref:Long chain acyl-CoA synthetase 4 n=1 Tax=Striga asiatica TaxID=4170 RepID=A0A5A7Q150_STRAF|nr:long chain acyl-CoA synthetase 4 [Striga asiatica]
MFGRREIVHGKPGKYIWVTYKEVSDIVLQIGNSIRSCGVADRGRCEIYGANSPERVISMEACNAHELYCAPLFDILGAGAPEGSLKFVDFRRTNFKHPGEEYVEVENFEKVYDIVSIWVYGNNWEAFLVAIINPTKQAVEQWEAQNFLVAIINPNIQAVEQWAAQIGVSGDCNALSRCTTGSDFGHQIQPQTASARPQLGASGERERPAAGDQKSHIGRASLGPKCMA